MGAVRDGGAVWVCPDQVQDDRVGDESGLDDLGQAAHVVGPRQRLQRDQVGEHAGGRMERADQVLALGDVDRGLAADRGVGHAQQRGRDQDHGDAAQPGRGHESGQVGSRSPADADDAIRPGHAVLRQLGPQPGGDVAVLAASPSGTVSARTRKPAALSAPHAGLAISPRLSAWMTTTVLASFGHQAGQFAEHADADDHLVRRAAVRGRDVDPGRGHCGSPLASLWVMPSAIRAAISSASSVGVQVIGCHRDRGESLVKPQRVPSSMARRRPRGLPGTTTRGRSSPIRRATVPKLADRYTTGRPASRCRTPSSSTAPLPSASTPPRVRERAAAAKRTRRRRPLELTEGLLAVLDEDVADRLARDGPDVRVGVAELHPEPVRDQRADDRLARAWRADQHHQRSRRPHEITRGFR